MEYDTSRRQLQQRIDRLDRQLRGVGIQNSLVQRQVSVPVFNRMSTPQQPPERDLMEARYALERLDRDQETRIVQQARSETKFVSKERAANMKMRDVKRKLKVYGRVGLPLIGVLAGVSLSIAGAAIANPALLAGGIAIASAAASRFEMPEDRKDKKEKTIGKLEKKLQELKGE